MGSELPPDRVGGLTLAEKGERKAVGDVVE